MGPWYQIYLCILQQVNKTTFYSQQRKTGEKTLLTSVYEGKIPFLWVQNTAKRDGQNEYFNIIFLQARFQSQWYSSSHTVTLYTTMLLSFS